MCLQYKSFENTVGKGEITHNEQFLLFLQCFLHFWRTFCHFHQIWNSCLQTLSVWKSLKFVVWERVKYFLAGGKFTREAVISYRAGGSVVIRQTFYGYDALNNIRMETHINGSIPNTVGSLTSITVDDYQEEYRRVGPGMELFSPNPFPYNDTFWSPGKQAFWKHFGKRRNC